MQHVSGLSWRHQASLPRLTQRGITGWGSGSFSTPEASQICSTSSQRLVMLQSWADTPCSHLSTTRWRAETNKLHATLKKSQGEVSQTGEDM